MIDATPPDIIEEARRIYEADREGRFNWRLPWDDIKADDVDYKGVKEAYYQLAGNKLKRKDWNAKRFSDEEILREEHWKREAEKERQRLANIEAIFKAHGFRMAIHGCGCCGSPNVRIEHNGELLTDGEEREFHLDMFGDEDES